MNEIDGIYTTDVISFIKWRLTEACNYKCSYCIRRITRGRSKDNYVFQDLSQLQRDWERCKIALPHVNRIIEEFPGKTAKIDMLGGEVTLLPLAELIEGLSPKVVHINITTNLSASVPYFKELIETCEKRKIDLYITASFHYESATLDAYVAKMKVLNTYISDYFHIKGEIVSVKENQDLVQQFIEAMENNNLPYHVDIDKKNFTDTLLCKSSILKKDVIRIVDAEGREQYFKTKGEAIRAVWGEHEKAAHTRGMYCTAGYDYIYIEKNNVMGRVATDNYSTCKQSIPIQYYHPIKQPLPCRREKCSLCGHFSLSRDINKLLRED